MNIKAYKWRFFLLLGILLLFCPAPAFGADAAGSTVFLSSYVQTLYDEESVIPVSQVKCALQTSDGYMWFVGYQGLMRYNGINTRVFAPEDGFPTYNVNILFEDSQQRLWVGTNDSGLALYNNNTFTMFGLAEGLPGASVRDIAEDENGNIYVAAAGGVARIDPSGRLYAYPALLNAFITQIEYIGMDCLLALANDGTATIIRGQAVVKTLAGAPFGDEQPISLYMAQDGSLYIGTSGSKIFITNSDLSFFQDISHPSLHMFNSFFEDSEKRLWVCADNGIGYLEDGKIISADGLLMNNSIELIYEDYEGSFWVCSSRQGLLQLTQSSFTNLSFAAQIPDYTVNTTAIYQGNLYIGADNGLIVLAGNTAIENELTALLDGIRIRCMLVDKQGWLWICTYERFGVLIVKPDGEIVSLNADKGLTSNQARCIIEGNDGSMIVGTSGGVNIIRDEKVVKTFRKENGLANDMILSLCQAENGVIYAGSDGGGIYALDGDNITNYTEKDGLPAGVILRMAIINGGLWISTGNSICYMEDSAAGTSISMIDKLMAYDDSVFDIRQVGDEIWFLQSKGVNICKTANLLSNDNLIITQLQRRDGLSAPITANSWAALDTFGTLYICTGKAVLAVNTASARQNSVTPYISISEVLADGKPLPLDGPLILPSQTQRLDIYTALLSYDSRDGTISYLLEGFDNEIQTVARGDAPWISYTNLKGGNYTLRLYGTNAGGMQSSLIVLPISKKYATLEMPLVRVFLAALILGMLALCAWFFVSRWTKTIDRQRKEYKEITKQAFLIIATMTDSKNEYTVGHSRRVAEYAEAIGQRLGLSDDELEALHFSALLHDIGRSSIPNTVLNKKQPLTSEEWEIVKTHAAIGGEMLRSITLIKDISLGARYHHERVDGKGYPEGLTGEEIPLAVKIISVANAFDTMLSDLPQRKALSLKEVKSEFIHSAGTQFDEKIVAALIEMLDEGMIPV